MRFCRKNPFCWHGPKIFLNPKFYVAREHLTATSKFDQFFGLKSNLLGIGGTVDFSACFRLLPAKCGVRPPASALATRSKRADFSCISKNARRSDSAESSLIINRLDKPYVIFKYLEKYFIFGLEKNESVIFLTIRKIVFLIFSLSVLWAEIEFLTFLIEFFSKI